MTNSLTYRPHPARRQIFHIRPALLVIPLLLAALAAPAQPEMGTTHRKKDIKAYYHSGAV